MFFFTKGEFGSLEAAELLHRDLVSGDLEWRRAEIFLPGDFFDLTQIYGLKLWPKFFFLPRSREREWSLALGTVAQGELRELLELKKELPCGSRIYGGRSFDEKPGSGIWEGFPGEFFFLPFLEFCLVGGTYKLAVNCHRDNIPNVDLLEHILKNFITEKVHSFFKLRKETKRFSNKKIIEIPDFKLWETEVDRAINEISRNGLEKVVLFRTSEVTFDQIVEGVDLLKRMIGRRRMERFGFLFEFDSNSGIFMGCSPELLYRRQGRKLITEAVAGTKPRACEFNLDHQFFEELTISEKEAKEHDYVVRFIVNSLLRIGSSVPILSGREVIDFENLRHLKTRIAVDLKAECDDEEILRVLHPTPATCGYPVEVAKVYIERKEKVRRGWYGGALGYVGHDEAEFCVGIRSFLLRSGKAYVFTGAGIVLGSQPGAEWEEMDVKVRDIFVSFDLDGI
ncbi:MAG: isochorismate synthase [Chthoniobacterales bacterium]|nr:isochorismate synthase [Chthoniobacterales bacterium]